MVNPNSTKALEEILTTDTSTDTSLPRKPNTPTTKLNNLFSLLGEMADYLSTNSVAPDDKLALRLANCYDAAVALVERLKDLPENTRFSTLATEYEIYTMFGYNLAAAAGILCASDAGAREKGFQERSRSWNVCPANNYLKRYADPNTIDEASLRRIKPILIGYIGRTKYGSKLSGKK